MVPQPMSGVVIESKIVSAVASEHINVLGLARDRALMVCIEVNSPVIHVNCF